MNKKTIRLVCALLVATLALSLIGCGQEQAAAEGKVTVWSTYNTVKVIQQTSRNDAYKMMDAQLTVQMMQNEYEGAQLIITSDKEISYSLTAGELKNANGDVFPGENVAIYHQKYLTVKTNYNGDVAFQAGDAIPDMLLPLEIATEYGENVIPANANQGVTVEFNSAGVPAGLYTGTFTLELDGKTQEIPVSVEVWDIMYEGRRQFQSCFMIYRDELMVGELDNSEAVVNAYIDKMLDYKTNAYVVRTYNTPEKMVEDTLRQFENNNFNSVIIPVDFQTNYRVQESGNITPAAQNAVDYIKALVKASTPEKNLVTYAYFYPSSYDEADVVEGRGTPSETFLCEGGEYQKTLQLAIEQLKDEGWFKEQTPEFAKQMEQDILQIPAVFTNVGFVDKWVGDLNAAFCPYISLFNNTSILNQYQDAAQENSFGDLWAYTCSGPINPYPTFHIDDGILDMRVCGWMEKAYDITGYLYYKVNAYTLIADNVENDYVDLYTDPARYYDVNGDGFLFYPGRYYGSSEPFASARLTAYRDGMDDYDMLCVYEKLLQEYARENNIENFDFDAYVDDLYHSLFSGVVAKQDSALLYAAREELAKRILALKNEGKLICDPADCEQVKLTAFENGEQTVTVRSEYKDKGEEIGTKTKMFRPSFNPEVSSMSGAKALYFTYENTGKEAINMQIDLVTESGEKVLASTSYCAPGKTREVKIFIDELEVDLADVVSVRLSFDNVASNEIGEVKLLPDKTFTISDLYIIK